MRKDGRKTVSIDGTVHKKMKDFCKENRIIQRFFVEEALLNYIKTLKEKQNE